MTWWRSFKGLLNQYHRQNIHPSILAAVIGGGAAILVGFLNLAHAIIQKPAPNFSKPAPANVAEGPTDDRGVATKADPYLFACAAIESLSHAKIAREKLISTQLSDEVIDDTLAMMVTLRLTKEHLLRAKSELRDFANIESLPISSSVRGFELAYDLIINAIDKALKVSERLPVVSGERELMSLVSEMSECLAQADEGWRTMLYATVAATHALADSKRTLDGKLAYLTITEKQQAELIARLEGRFGDSVRGGVDASKHVTDVAPAVLWEFLSGSWKPSDAGP